MIDTSSTRIQTNYDQQTLASIPNARDMWSLLATTPSVTLNRIDVGGATAGTQTTYFAYGYSGRTPSLSAYYDFETQDIQGKNLEDSQIIPNTAIRRTATVWRNTRTSTSTSAAQCFLDGTPFRTKLFNYTGKATYMLNANTNVNISWLGGARFERATTVLQPPHSEVRCQIRLVNKSGG